MTPNPPAARTSSSLPVVGLVCSVLGFCVPPLLPVGIVLGVIALVQAKGSKTLAALAVALPVAAIPVFGILAAIAIPNFIKFQARAKQGEVKTNLHAAFVAEKAFYEESKTFSLHPEQIGFAPERGNRYLYVFAMKGTVAPNTGAPSKDAMGVGIDTQKFPTMSNELSLNTIPREVADKVGVSGQCPECEVTIVAAGNIDNDPTMDVWTVSSADRPGTAAGVPFNEVNDLTD